MDSAPDMKPKKVLTEAQRLAFLKGREKRMANIEKKRLEKEELKEVEAPPPMPELKRHEPTLAPAVAPAPATAPAPAPGFDESKIADTIAERVWAKLESAKPKRKPYTRKPKSESTPTTPPAPPPPTQTFTWM